jgi:hypothetical protein
MSSFHLGLSVLRAVRVSIVRSPNRISTNASVSLDDRSITGKSRAASTRIFTVEGMIPCGLLPTAGVLAYGFACGDVSIWLVERVDWLLSAPTTDPKANRAQSIDRDLDRAADLLSCQRRIYTY